MERAKLTETLEAVHRELASSEQVDPQARDLLQELLGDIQRLLDEPSGARAREDEGLGDRVTDVAATFEADHPRLAATVRQVIDALATMGI